MQNWTVLLKRNLAKAGGYAMFKKSAIIAIVAAVILSSGCSYNASKKMVSSSPQKIVAKSINYTSKRPPLQNMNSVLVTNSMLRTRFNETSHTNVMTNLNNIKSLSSQIIFNCNNNDKAAVEKNTASLIKYWNAVKPSVYTSERVKTQGIVNSLNRYVGSKNLNKAKSLCNDLVRQSAIMQNNISNQRV